MSLNTYIKDTKGELKHVTWPTQQQTIAFTVIVVVLAVFVGVLLGFFDFIFTTLFKMFII
jgi:preprotein translocase SecE subunit